VVRTRFEALHRWPGATPNVFYLASPHRHLFHVEVVIRVLHDDRDVEFFTVKEELDTFLSLQYARRNIGARSCEMIAREIRERFADWDVVRVSVFEDGENGAEVLF